MKWQYLASLFLLILSQIVFFFLMWYHTDSNGYSWILYHEENWIWSFVFTIVALFVFIMGLLTDSSINQQKGKKSSEFDNFD